MNRKYDPTAVPKDLTKRELKIFSLAAVGYKSKNIAEILFVSVATIKKTFANIYYKFNAKNKTNAVATALLNNMIDVNMLNHVAAKYKINLDENIA